MKAYNLEEKIKQFVLCSIFKISQKMGENIFQFDTQIPPGLQFEGTFQCGIMTSGRTSRARTDMAKFFTLQAQAIAGFSSCGEVACYPKFLRISYNSV